MDSRKLFSMGERYCPILTCDDDTLAKLFGAFIPTELSLIIHSMRIPILKEELHKKFMFYFPQQYGNIQDWLIIYDSFNLESKAAVYKELFEKTMSEIHPALVAQFREPVLAILTNSVLTASLPSYVLKNIVDELFMIICHTLAYFMVPPPDVVRRSLRAPYEPSHTEKLLDNWNGAFICLLNHYHPEQNCGDYMSLASSFTRGMESWLSKVTNEYQGMY